MKNTILMSRELVIDLSKCLQTALQSLQQFFQQNEL